MKDPAHRLAGTPVWDVSVRLFHWSLAGLFAVCYLTGGHDRWFVVHKAAGIGIVALIVYRLAWGVVGSHHARFANFLRGPAAAWGHVRDLVLRRPGHTLGHNPLGGYGVVVLLALCLVQTLSGLFATGIDQNGPLAYLLPDGLSSWLADVHAFNLDILIAMVAVHVGAVLVTSILTRDNLIRAMLTGRKRTAGPAVSARLQAGAPPVVIVRRHLALALTLSAAALAAIVILSIAHGSLGIFGRMASLL